MYSRDDVNLIVVQQRSPTLKVRTFPLACQSTSSACPVTERRIRHPTLGLFARLWRYFYHLLIRSRPFKQDRCSDDVRLLPPGARHSLTLFRTPFYSISPKNAPQYPGLADLPIPAYTSPVPQHIHDDGSEPPAPFIPGGGLTRRIISSLPPSWPIPTVSLLQFVLEGDNKADAQMFASVIAQVGGFNSLIKQWKQPGSWNPGLFGTPHDQTLYG